ncbi:uncharacterized protein LOC142954950 [Anarhichas minor]|uniref:uncharacterized protein LOC142954950 n=1 Tax=Anarhichas minor TaxID=65739 RepID=UPI003F731FE2
MGHLRTLLHWPEVRLHKARPAAHRVGPHCCDKEASPERCHEEEWTTDVSPDHPSTLHVEEEPDQRADQQGPCCGQQCDTTRCPHFVKREGHEQTPSRLYRILTVEQTADIKAEPDGDVLITSPSTSEAEILCGINPDSPGLQQETLKDPPEITRRERDGLDEQQYVEQDRSPCQDYEDPDAPQIKVEKFTSSSPQEDTDHDYELPLQSQSSVYDKSHSSSHSQTLTNKTSYTAERERRDTEGEGCKLSRLARVSQSFYSVNQSECDLENTEGAVNGEWIQTFTPTGTRQKKSDKGDWTIGLEEDVNDLNRERRHICPICAKRFKNSGHLKDHVRIHTGEKPYQCKECGVNFKQRGTLTLHTRIHTGERPYQCTDCGRRFIRKHDMKKHRVTHTRERPHLCMVCGKSFKRKCDLNTHLKVHAEDKMDQPF